MFGHSVLFKAAWHGDRLDAHQQMMDAGHVLPRNNVILFICEES